MPNTQRKVAPPPVPPPPREVGFEDILSRLNATGRPVDVAFLRAVYAFSEESHREQKRLSGEPFFTHPLQVAWLLADWKFDEVCVAGGLLHDVLEDTLSTRDALLERFGKEVAELVDGVTKIGRHAYVRRDQVQAETFRKMILASSKDIRVILVKLADRLHNLQTAVHLPPETRRRVAQETLEIYAPIAHRLGMSKVKGDLEDLAFYHLYPHQFTALHGELEERLKLGQTLNRKISERLGAALAEAGIPAEITSRVKRYHSIWQKLRRQGVDIAQLYDYLAFRIVTENLRDTYAALGVVHQIWRPIPGRFKDYIAMPKPNLYQSLHTTLVGDRGQPFEVQIRTAEMDRVADEGIAAHWGYKEGRDKGATDGNVLWLRQLLEVQQEVDDPRAFLTSLKVDLYPDEVYAFTPKGEVFSFPQNATPLDFAYRVHTDLGHRCSGARVNGRLVPIRTPLQNGDIVEILTSPNRSPSRDWLGFVATSRAKSKIRQWLSSQQKTRSLEIGRRLLEKELREYKVSVRKVLEGESMRRYLSDQGLAKLDDLLSRVAFGKAVVAEVVRAVLSPQELAVPAVKPGRLRAAVSKILPFGSSAAGPISIKGHGDLLTFLAKCCDPLPGDEIVGYVTRGRGVSVHSVDCPNVKNLLYDPAREIEVEWGRDAAGTYPVTLAVETEDRPGMIARLTEAIANQGSNIRQLEASTSETNRGLIDLVVEVRDRGHLDRLRQAVRGVAGVLLVERRPGAGLRKVEGGAG